MRRQPCPLVAPLIAALCLTPALAQRADAAVSNPIQHIIVVMQEDRSFDNLFCSFPKADGECGSQTIPLEAQCEISHTFGDFRRDQITGNFNGETTNCGKYKSAQYRHVVKREIRPYFAIAHSYVLGDKMFGSTGNPSFEAHQYLIAAQTAKAMDLPYGTAQNTCLYHMLVNRINKSAIPACFQYSTLGDELDGAALPWTYYEPGFSSRIPDWDAFGWIANSEQYSAHIVSPETQFLTDVSNGKLAAVTWIIPAYNNSDDPGAATSTGPSWVAAIVNAVGESQFWSTSAVVVTWSGFGGWADHVAPPQLDVEGLGFRVPVLVVSPYAYKGVVAHQQYETASIDRFIEDTFGLQTMAAADARATDLASGTLNLNQAPRAFVPIPSQ